MPRIIVLVAALALVATLTLGDPIQDCSGHGALVDGKCRCENPWPTEQGQSGWVGPECSIPVYSGKADGADMAAACGGCASLEPGGWACFAVQAPFNDSSFNYMTVLLNRTSAEENGDPDLFGARPHNTQPSAAGLAPRCLAAYCSLAAGHLCPS